MGKSNLIYQPNGLMRLKEAANSFGVTVDQIIAPDRTREMTDIRAEAAYNMRIKSKMSLSAIGRVMNRDHTTIGYYIERHKADLGLEIKRFKYSSEMKARQRERKNNQHCNL